MNPIPPALFLFGLFFGWLITYGYEQTYGTAGRINQIYERKYAELKEELHRECTVGGYIHRKWLLPPQAENLFNNWISEE